LSAAKFPENTVVAAAYGLLPYPEALATKVLLVSARARHFGTAILLNKGRKMNTLKMLWQDEEGQDLVEYGLLLVLISLVAVGAMKTLGSGVSDAFSNAAANLAST
jgi:pilus assembly protein Flp/PilA